MALRKDNAVTKKLTFAIYTFTLFLDPSPIILAMLVTIIH